MRQQSTLILLSCVSLLYSSPPDVSLCSTSPGEETDLTVTETTPSSVIVTPPCSKPYLSESRPSSSGSGMEESMSMSLSSLSNSVTSLGGSSPVPEETNAQDQKCSRRNCLNEEIPGKQRGSKER